MPEIMSVVVANHRGNLCEGLVISFKDIFLDVAQSRLADLAVVAPTGTDASVETALIPFFGYRVGPGIVFVLCFELLGKFWFDK